MSEKQKQKFQQFWSQMIALTGNEKPEKDPKIPSNEVVSIFNEFAAEREAEARETFKKQLKGIMQAKVALDKVLDKGRKELLAKEEKEYETLNAELKKAMDSLEAVRTENANLTNQASGNFEDSTLDDSEG